MIAGLRPDETILVHGGAGGIGTFAIQLAAQLGARVFTTAGTPEKRELCTVAGRRRGDRLPRGGLRRGGARAHRRRRRRRDPGQHGGVVPRPQRRRARHRGPAGGDRPAGRHQGRARPQRAAAQARRDHRDHAARARPAEEKAAICASVVEHVWPLVADGSVRPIVHRTLPLDEVAAAHELMESGEHSGKILLTMQEDFETARK